ncbi:uncharacterized protein LOC127862554 [Dreissena polymorpha]|uniref:Uncharacterized protein n=1 Tax=Dreissena polymorpha TaxID=45954 RepID=A0A9D3Y7L2_DREPO|nr:uncharacterized protein LOC127862554 [Dreissena polymorpha]KAH3695368.1 hypothetical protein DPMN_082825 [Dreissena polymorpha]
MAASTRKSKWTETNEVLFDILKEADLPLEVKVYDEYANHTVDSDLINLSDSKLLIVCRKSLSFARVHILESEFFDGIPIEQRNDFETIAERANYVGKEYYIPMKYHRRLQTDTMIQPTNMRSGRLTFTNTKRTATVNKDGTYTRLIHCLQALKDEKICPLAFSFVNPEPEDVVHFDDEKAGNAYIFAQGPLAYLGCIDIPYVIAWKREPGYKSYSTVLIPESMWKDVRVKRRVVSDATTNMEITTRRYQMCQNIDFVETRLYCVDTDFQYPIILRSPDMFKVIRTGSALKQRCRVPYRESSEEEQEEEEEELNENPTEQPSVVGDTYEERHKYKMKSHVKSDHGEKSTITADYDFTEAYNRIDLDKRYVVIFTDKEKPLAVSSSDNYERKTPETWVINFDPLSEKEKEEIEIPGKSDEDFYALTVLKLCYLLCFCGLLDVAMVCYRHKLDGEFFRMAKQDVILNKPFSLSELEKVKFDQIIQGWRPKVKDSVSTAHVTYQF